MINYLINMFGYEILKKKKIQTINNHLQYIFTKLKIDYVIDVGANEGQFALSLRRNNYKGDILSFEPASKPFKKLVENSKNDAHWYVKNIALGEKKELRKMNVFEASDLNSFYEASELGKNRFNKGMKKIETETIEIKTLDSVLKKIDLKNKNIFLKMDTQGFDISVFRGTNKHMSKISGLMSEIPIQKIYKITQSYHDILKEYEAQKFQISAIFPVSQNKKNHTAIEFDCVMIKT
jgi:FkbM family methyltransferase